MNKKILPFVCSVRVVSLFVYTLHFLFLSLTWVMWQTVYASECSRKVMKLSHISRVAKIVTQFNDLFWINTRAFARSPPFDKTLSDKGDVMHNKYKYAIHRRQ